MRRIVREKKHRLPREAYQGLVLVSFTVCVQERRTPFVGEAIVRDFVIKLTDATGKNGCCVPIYCFMPDHLHLVLQGVDDRADTWRAMVNFKQQTGFWFGRQHCEFTWQKDFHDHVLRSDEDIGAHVRYIAGNPVRWGLVQHWQEYRFTGAIGVDLRDVMGDIATL